MPTPCRYSAWDYSRLEQLVGGPVKLRLPAGEVAVHYRGGSIIPMQDYAPLTRDVRLSPITLVVALPSQPSSGRVDGAAGPLPPYSLEAFAGAVHAASAGSLVSVGHLFMDGGEDITIGADNSLQVWFSAVAAPGGGSGTITSSVKSAGGDAASKLVIEAVTILGVPSAGGSVVLEAAKLASAQLNGRRVLAAYDAAAGVVKLSGLSLPVGEPLNLSWEL
jgi:hypothetical protein